MRRTILTPVLTTLACCLVARADSVTFHLMQIEQIIGGVNGDTTAQAVQLRMRSPAQLSVAGARLLAHDAAGLNPVLLIDFASNVALASCGQNVLVTSAGFDAQTSPLATPDFTLTNLVPPSYLPAGSMTFETDAGTILWRVSWGGGAYTGPTTGAVTNDPDGDFGPPWPGALPSGDLQALAFQGACSDTSATNAADYILTSTPAVFTNNAGQSFTTVGIPLGACCDDTTGTCQENVTEVDCTSAGFRYGGDDSTCNTIDPPCSAVPTVSQWGLVVMTLVILSAGTTLFARRRTARI